MPWHVEYTDQFKERWDTPSEEQQDGLSASVELLMAGGPMLSFLCSSGIAISRQIRMML